jgi:hypothetical protein
MAAAYAAARARTPVVYNTLSIVDRVARQGVSSPGLAADSAIIPE